jgi:4-amino-4-deoxy-L-arabinose transferase-like glycosyltransferase
MNVRASEVLPYIVAALFLLVVTVYYAQFLNNGPLRHYDEYLTLDRSAGFQANGDWATVFGNNRPTFNKPPLQYWISAGLLAAGVSP